MSLPTLNGTARIVGDVELRTGNSGKPWLLLSLLFIGKKQDPATGAWVDDATYYCQAVAFGPLAQNVAASATKGSELYVTGSLKDNKWTKEGVEHTRPQLVIDTAALSLRWQAAVPAPQQRPTSHRAEPTRRRAERYAHNARSAR